MCEESDYRTDYLTNQFYTKKKSIVMSHALYEFLHQSDCDDFEGRGKYEVKIGERRKRSSTKVLFSNTKD